MGILAQIKAATQNPPPIPPPAAPVEAAPEATPTPEGIPVPVEATPTEDAKPKRTRKPKATPPAETAAAYAATPETSTKDYPPAFTETTQHTFSTFALYFNAFPVGIPTKTLHAYVASLEAAVAENFPSVKGSDIRLAEEEPLKFGRWKAVLAKLATSAPPTGAYLVTGGDERIEVVAEALAGIALPGMVIRGGGR